MAGEAERDLPRRLGLVFALGLFSLSAQSLLFRDFLAALEGHEFALGLFFSSWLIWVSIGAWLARGGHGVSRFAGWALLYLPAVIAQHLLLLFARPLAGVEAFELFPLWKMIPISLLANAPVSVMTGMLFTMACGWTSRRQALPAAAVYLTEAGGAMAGGMLATVLLAFGFPEVFVFLVVAAFLCIAVAVAPSDIRARRMAGAGLLAALALLAARADRPFSRMEDRWWWSRLMPPASFRGGFSTPQARYRYGEYGGAFNVVAWESVCETVPDIESASEIAALHLARKPDARRVLVIGPGSLTLCERLLALPGMESVTWLHPDPQYPASLLKALPEALQPDRSRLRIPERDVRSFLRDDPAAYDLILLNLPEATTLAMSRFFSREFLALARGRLAPDGVVSARIPGGENVLGGELIRLGAGVYATVQAVFRSITLKPGDETWIMGSDRPGFQEDPAVLEERYRAIPGAEALYPAEGLSVLYPPDRIRFQRTLYEEAIRTASKDYYIHTDDRPRTILYSLLWLGKQAAGGTGWSSVLLDPVNGMMQAAFAIGIALLLVALYRRPAWEGEGGEWGYAGCGPTGAMFMAFVGWVGLACSLILMFQFQLRYGSLFLHVGLVSGLFMVGLVAGGLVTRKVVAGGNRIGVVLSGVTLLHLVLLGRWAVGFPDGGYGLFAALFFLAGFFQGAYVPLIAAVLDRAGVADIQAGASIEWGDNLGGAFGGAVTGLYWLPLCGARISIVLTLLLTALGGVWFAGLYHRQNRRFVTPAERIIRLTAYVAGAIILNLLFYNGLVRMNQWSDRDRILLRAGEKMAPGVSFARVAVTGADEKTWRYYAGKGNDGADLALFETADLAGDVRGYAGSLNLAVLMRSDGVLLGLDVLTSNETASYMDRLRDWMAGLPGRNLFQPDEWRELDIRTGATLTSRAILRILERSGAGLPSDRFRSERDGRALEAERGRLDPSAMALAAFAIGMAALRIRPGRIRRRIFLALVVLILGVWLNAQYALFHVFSILSVHLPEAGFNLPFMLMVAMPVVVLLFGNVYCGHLCPFGAMQELMGEWAPASWRMDPDATTWAWGRRFKYLALFLLLAVFAVRGGDIRMADGDPLAAVFRGFPNRFGLALAVLALLAALFYRRFWCRTICPAGAFLSLLSGLRAPARWRPRIHPALCDQGVRHYREIDCLCCDRCRMPPGPAGASRFEPGPRWVFFLLVLGVGLLLIGQCWPAARPMEREEAAVRGGATIVPGGAGMPRDIEVDLFRRLIRQGRLSDREALHYRAVTNAGETRREKE